MAGALWTLVGYFTITTNLLVTVAKSTVQARQPLEWCELMLAQPYSSSAAAEGRSGYQLFGRAPAGELRPFIRRFLIVEFPRLHRDAHLPSTSPVAAFSFGGACRIDGGTWAPRAAFTTSWRRMRAHEHCHSHRVLLATFTPAGAAAFLRPPLEELAEMTVDLANVLIRPRELAELDERLYGAPDHEQRISRLEVFLRTRIGESAPDPVVAAASAWLEKGAGSGRIDALARRVGLSQSALERRFRRVTGMPPKAFARVARLERAARLAASGDSFAAAAQAAGYFDQSHFIRDFRQAAGMSPGAFFDRSAD